MSMHLDTTIYPVGFVPEQLLKNLMAKERLFAGIRLAWAMREMTTIQRMAVVGDTATEAFTNLSTLLQESDWPAAPSAREPETFKIKAIWAQSVLIAKKQAEQEVLYSSDPSKVPVIPESDRLCYRSAWLTQHPGHELHEFNEPHPRFIDRIHRDWKVHSRILFYELLEMRVLADRVISRQAIRTTTDQLLQAVAEDMPGAPVNSCDQALDRLHSFFVALEFCTIWGPDNYYQVACRYINRLKKFYRDNGDSLLHLTKADSKFRKAVDKVMQEDLSKTYAAAFLELLEKGHHLWDSAKLEADVDRYSGGSRAGTKRSQPDSPAASSPASASAKRRQRKAAAKARPQVQSQLPWGSPAKGKGGGKSKGGKSGQGKNTTKGGAGKSASSGSIPAAEMTLIMTALEDPRNRKVCRFYNSSKGCSLGDGCQWTHKCATCGAAHAMVGNH